MKAHPILWRFRRGHEFSDRGHELADRVVVAGDLAFELVELAGQLFVRQHQLPQLDERAHHEHADLDRSRRVEQTGGHVRTVLGEGVGQVAATTTSDV